jgi:hypothetical protein
VMHNMPGQSALMKITLSNFARVKQNSYINSAISANRKRPL